VIRLRERFGAAYTVKVLTGSNDHKIIQAGHHQLSTYNLLGNESTVAVKTWIDQLVSQNFLERYGEYNQLRITPSGRDLLQRKGKVMLTRVTKSASVAKAAAPAVESWADVDRGLFDRLRALRSELASQRRVPAYVIFGDATLRDLARLRPSDLSRLSRVRGIGERKLAEFGELFLNVIDEYCGEHPMPRDVAGNSTQPPPVATTVVPQSVKGAMAQQQAHTMFAAGKTIDEVALQMGRARSTVAGYLNNYLVEAKVTDGSPWVAADKIAKIEAAIPASEDGRLKPIMEALEGDKTTDHTVTYEEIRIVVTCWRNTQDH
jgi:ATP-dependent DNA helicase RecQ